MGRDMRGQTPVEIVRAQRERVSRQVASDMDELGQGWGGLYLPTMSPWNPANGRVFRGVNRVHLACAARLRGIDDGRWSTFNQIREAGWRVRKGSKAAIIERWKEVKGHFSRPIGYWNVFNASDMTGTGDLGGGPVQEAAPARARLLLSRAGERGHVPSEPLLRSASCRLAWEEVLADTDDPSDEASLRLSGELAFLFLLYSLGVRTLGPTEAARPSAASMGALSDAVATDPDLLFRAAARAERAAARLLGPDRAGR